MISFNKEFILKAFIVVVILSFIFSTLWIGMSNSNNNNNNNNNNPQNDTEDVYLMGQGKVALIIKEYSGIIELDKINNESLDFINAGIKNGEVSYFDTKDSKITIVLSDKSKTYDYAKILLENDPTVSMILKARVYNNQKYDFTTDDGQVVSAIIPESEIKVSYPYELGEILYYSALVQLLNGNVVGAQLYPLAKVEELDMIFLVNEIKNEYYSRLYFNWRDRETVRTISENMNLTLTEMGVTNFQKNYVSDITIYANRTLTYGEMAILQENYANIKTTEGNKIVFYDNSTETEEEISNFVYNMTNGTASLSFSPPMLEFVFTYDGKFSEIESSLNDLNNLAITKYYGVKANVSTGDTNVVSGNNTYQVKEINLIALIPTSTNLNDIIPLKVEATINANTIVEVEQIIDFGY